MEGRGCSRFQNKCEMYSDAVQDREDIDIERDGAEVDQTSLAFIKGAIIVFLAILHSVAWNPKEPNHRARSRGLVVKVEDS